MFKTRQFFVMCEQILFTSNLQLRKLGIFGMSCGTRIESVAGEGIEKFEKIMGRH